jgi:hypothetical protein
MSKYASSSDDHYINVSLNTELDLPCSRDSVLHLFEQVRKKFPSMDNLTTRERTEFVLEENKELGSYRWTSVDARSISAGYVNPPAVDDARDLARAVLAIAPYALSISPLDCESLSVMYGFDFVYRGNHNLLVAEALGVYTPFEGLAQMPGARLLAYEPSIQLALDEDCRLQCRVGIESRTSAFQIRSGDYPGDHLSVYAAVRRVGSLPPDQSFEGIFEQLQMRCEELVDHHVVDNLLVPLQHTIAIK